MGDKSEVENEEGELGGRGGLGGLGWSTRQVQQQ